MTTESKQEYWNQDAEKYRQLADLLRVIAEKHCHVPIDDETHLRWREIMALMTEVDSYVDDRIVPGINTMDDIAYELTSFNRFRDRYPHISPESLGRMQFQELAEAGWNTIRYVDRLYEADSYDDYVAQRTEEAMSTVRLFEVTATETVQAVPQFNEYFLPKLEQMGISACMLDSAKDLKGDFNEGRASLRPSIGNRFRLLGEAFGGGVDQVDLLRLPSIRREIGKAAILHIGRHFRSRGK